MLAGAALVNMVGRSPIGPLFAVKPALANIAIVPAPGAAERSPTSRGASARFSRARDGLFYVRATVNGVPVRFVLDTGATLVVLTPQDAKRIGLTGHEGGPSDRMETAGGFSDIRRATIDRVDVSGHAITDVDAAVVDNGLKTSLLGQNLLSQLGPITLSTDEAELQ